MTPATSQTPRTANAGLHQRQAAVENKLLLINWKLSSRDRKALARASNAVCEVRIAELEDEVERLKGRFYYGR